MQSEFPVFAVWDLESVILYYIITNQHMPNDIEYRWTAGKLRKKENGTWIKCFGQKTQQL